MLTGLGDPSRYAGGQGNSVRDETNDGFDSSVDMAGKRSAGVLSWCHPAHWCGVMGNNLYGRLG
jgi:hypothetical protein